VADQPEHALGHRSARHRGEVADESRDTTHAHGKERRPRAIDAAVLLGLGGVAITQPLLDLLGRNPTFFVAGNYTDGQIIWFSLVVAVAPAAVVFTLAGLTGLPNPRLRSMFHGLGVAALASLFGLAVARTVGLDGLGYVVPAVVGLAAAVAVAENRTRIARQFLSYLALGNAAFVVMFLTASPTAELMWTSDVGSSRGTVVVPPLTGPILVVVLDEFPVTAILRGDGSIIDTRYPNLARLAESSTWFRNAASESSRTQESVPTILSGVRAAPEDLPVFNEYPRNYFTVFGNDYPVNSYELVTDLCPAGICESSPAPSTRLLFDDVFLIYQHRILPPALRDGLPPVNTKWGAFDDDAAVGTGAGISPTKHDFLADAREIRDDETGAGSAGQAGIFERQIGLIGAEPSVNFVHVLLPHHPYRLTPWGEGRLTATLFPEEVAGDANKLPSPEDPAYEFRFRQIYLLLAMQIGAVDTLLGDMIDHLQSTGAWDRALVVITSDHGIDVTAPGFKRNEDESNTDELLRVPLFIKAPGQTEGRVDDAPASTVDVLPSIIDLLDIETDWDFDGHSLFDGSQSSIDRHVQSDVEAAFRLAAAHESQFPRGEDWVSLAAVGKGEDLVGNPASDYRVDDASALRWSIHNGQTLDNLSLAEDDVPYILEGTVEGSDGRPPELVVAVNGTLAGTIGGYLQAGDAWDFTGYIAPFFEDGRNKLVAYEVERTGDVVTLHRLAGE